MPELIDRQALIKDMCNNKTDAKCPCYPNCYPCEFSEARRIIDEQPTIEAEPVRHGRWIRNATSEGYHCSNCGHHADSPIGEMIDPRDYECYLDKYCGGCGAQMYADGGTISKERIAEIMAEILGGAENG